MKRVSGLKNLLFGSFAASLILLVSLGAFGFSLSYTSKHDHHQAETYSDQNAGVRFAEEIPLLILPDYHYFFLYRVANLVDTVLIHYRNCRAFFLHPSSFNSYYFHLTALAP